MDTDLPLRLSRKQRRVVGQWKRPLYDVLYQLKWVEGLTLDGLAERLEVTRGTAQVWLRKYQLRRADVAQEAAVAAYCQGLEAAKIKLGID